MSEHKTAARQPSHGLLRSKLRNPFAKDSAPPQPPPEPIAAISSTVESHPASVEDVPQLPAAKDKEGGRKKATPPPGTFEYVVQEGDKLRSLAAKFDTTPSVLKKLNRLTMDFLYPDQVLRIPDENYVTLNTPPDKPPSEPSPQAAHPHTLTKEEEVAPKKVFPGHLVRKDVSCHSIVDEMDLPPRPLSQDEAEYLDQECFERFIKIHSMYITEHNGPIDGVLLVTPNAVMFDPNVSNPLVVEKGADEFGMIAKMETIMSASIYHDMEAMQSLRDKKKDAASTKPLVYHPSSSSPGAARSSSPPPTDNAAVKSENACSAATATANTDSLTHPHQSSHDAIPAGSASVEGHDTASSKELSHVSGDAPNSEAVDVCDSVLAKNASYLAGDNHTQVETLLDDPADVVGLLLKPSDLTALSLPVVEKSGDFDSETVVNTAMGCEHTTEKLTDTDSDIVSTDYRQVEAGEAHTAPTHEFTVIEYDLSNQTHTVGQSCFYVNRHQTKTLESRAHSSKAPLRFHAALQLSDRPELFESLQEMVPEGLAIETHKQAAQEPSLYLCLRVGQPINKSVSTTCPIESYSKKKRPEYCFSIPRDKVDILYAFFIQWKPEVYDQDEVCGNTEGFVAVKEDGSTLCNDTSNAYTEESEQLSHHLGHQVSLDWEILSWEEVRRRRTIDEFEKYVHLPEFKSESLIITENHVKKLLRCLPARVEGYPWELTFGSEQHGYSLHQMYRNMNDLDCPVLLIIETTENMIFGALSSCPFHMSESFYGTGESFLFTFVDGFKTYPWTGTNNFFNRGDNSCLIIGSGEGSHGLWLDEDLYLGRTQNCQTYANDPLTGHKEDFHIKRLEVWSFYDES